MFGNPEQNIRELGLQEGMRVADLGAGSGFYSKAASARVGTTGKVYAIEVQKDMVKKLEHDLKEWGISNVSCIWGDIEKIGGTKIADGSIDAVIISSVLSQVEDKIGLIDEAKRILKKEGRILLIDWSDSLGSTDSTSKHIVPQDRAVELFIKRGLIHATSISVSSHHYGIIFTR